MHPLPPRPDFAVPSDQFPKSSANLPERPPLSPDEQALLESDSLAHILRSHYKPAQDGKEACSALDADQLATVQSKLLAAEENGRALQEELRRRKLQDKTELHKQERKEIARLKHEILLEKRKNDPHNELRSNVPTHEAVSTRTRSKMTHDSDEEEEFHLRASAPPKKRRKLLQLQSVSHEHDRKAKQKATKAVCSAYLSRNCTRHPSTCQYAHPTGADFVQGARFLEAHAGSSPEASDIRIRIDDGKRVCHQYLRRRCTKNSEKCRFSHPTGEAYRLMRHQRGLFKSRNEANMEDGSTDD